MQIMVGGEAGQGVESGGAGFAKALARGGLHVFGLQDYMSRIRGGHNFYQVRVPEEQVWAQADGVQLLLAFNTEAVELHLDEVVPGGGDHPRHGHQGGRGAAGRARGQGLRVCR